LLAHVQVAHLTESGKVLVREFDLAPGMQVRLDPLNTRKARNRGRTATVVALIPDVARTDGTYIRDYIKIRYSDTRRYGKAAYHQVIPTVVPEDSRKETE
jgi:hypothetical protein